MEFVELPGRPRPRGYAVATVARGSFVFISGQIGWDENERLVGADIVSQTRQALLNVVAVATAAGGAREHVARMTWFVTDKRAYVENQREIGLAYREVMGRHYPAMSVVEVSALVEDGALVEIEATAVLP